MRKILLVIAILVVSLVTISYSQEPLKKEATVTIEGTIKSHGLVYENGKREGIAFYLKEYPNFPVVLKDDLAKKYSDYNNLRSKIEGAISKPGAVKPVTGIVSLPVEKPKKIKATCLKKEHHFQALDFSEF